MSSTRTAHALSIPSHASAGAPVREPTLRERMAAMRQAANAPAPAAAPAAHLASIPPAPAARRAEAEAGPSLAAEAPPLRAVRPAPSHALSAAQVGALVQIITRPLEPGVTAQAGHAGKEHELRQFIDTLTSGEALALHTRLRVAAAGDEVVVAFARLLGERRDRLMAYLGDSRRRAALRAAGR